MVMGSFSVVMGFRYGSLHVPARGSNGVGGYDGHRRSGLAAAVPGVNDEGKFFSVAAIAATHQNAVPASITVPDAFSAAL